MKKLKLKLEGKQMMSKEQMKQVNGGTCNYSLCECPNGHSYCFICPDPPYGQICLGECGLLCMMG